jgi:quercetin dioxygenase-like cupin family protein
VPLAVIVVVALLATLTGGSLNAQEGTPAAEEAFMLPEGVTAEPLAGAVTQIVPPAPALMELIRFTFEPGAVLHLPEESPSTALVYVEAGTLTARVAATLTVTRAAVGGTREEIAAGTEFTAEAGDFFIGPAHIAVEARNDGPEPLVLLMAVIEPVTG